MDNSKMTEVLLDAVQPVTWNLREKIGNGAYGIVWSAVREDLYEETCAIKVTTSPGNKSREMLRREIAIHSNLDHPNVVRYVNSFEAVRCNNMVMKATFSEGDCTVLILEFVPGMNFEKLVLESGGISTPVLQRFVRDIANSLVYLKKKGIVHRDVKPQNVLYDNEIGIFKLADFGLAKKAKHKSTSGTGTPNYMAPEVLLAQPYKDYYYDHSCDVWSFGISIYFGFYSRVPWRSKNFSDFKVELSKGISKEMLNHSPDDLKSLLKMCLTFDSEKRIKVEDILEHEFVLKN